MRPPCASPIASVDTYAERGVFGSSAMSLTFRYAWPSFSSTVFALARKLSSARSKPALNSSSHRGLQVRPSVEDPDDFTDGRVLLGRHSVLMFPQSHAGVPRRPRSYLLRTER